MNLLGSTEERMGCVNMHSFLNILVFLSNHILIAVCLRISHTCTCVLHGLYMQYNACNIHLYMYTGCQYWKCYPGARKSRWGVFVWFSQYCSSVFVSSHAAVVVCVYLPCTHKFMLCCRLNMYSVVYMLNRELLKTGSLSGRTP